jgi:hypothetical protein
VEAEAEACGVEQEEETCMESESATEACGVEFIVFVGGNIGVEAIEILRFLTVTASRAPGPNIFYVDVHTY